MVIQRAKADMIVFRNAMRVEDYLLGGNRVISPFGTVNANDERTKTTGDDTDKTPVASGAENISGRGNITLDPSEDVQEKTDFRNRRIHRTYGNFTGAGQLVLPVDKKRRVYRFGSIFDKLKEAFLIPEEPMVYDVLLLYSPDYKNLNATQAEMVLQMYAFTRGDAKWQLQAGGNDMQVAINYEEEREYGEPEAPYLFGAELLGVTAFVADDEINPDAQPRIETRLKVTLTGTSGSGDITFRGLGYDENDLEETFAITGDDVFYTDNLFSRIYDDTDGDCKKGILIGTGLSGNIKIEADELFHAC